jgi:hypothetical protein
LLENLNDGYHSDDSFGIRSRIPIGELKGISQDVLNMEKDGRTLVDFACSDSSSHAVVIIPLLLELGVRPSPTRHALLQFLESRHGVMTDDVIKVVKALLPFTANATKCEAIIFLLTDLPLESEYVRAILESGVDMNVDILADVPAYVAVSGLDIRVGDARKITPLEYSKYLRTTIHLRGREGNNTIYVTTEDLPAYKLVRDHLEKGQDHSGKVRDQKVWDWYDFDDADLPKFPQSG